MCPEPQEESQDGDEYEDEDMEEGSFEGSDEESQASQTQYDFLNQAVSFVY